MWLREEPQDDKPPTDYEYDEYDEKKMKTFTASEAAPMNNPHSEPGDEWNEKTPISDESNDEPFMANTRCDSSAPTGAGSERSARKAWFPQLSGATAQLVDHIKVDHYKPDTYAEGCYVAGLKQEYQGKLEKRWSELACAALTTYGPQALDCDDYGRPIRPRRSKRTTVKSQSDPWYKRVPSLLTEHFTNPGSAYTVFAQIRAARTSYHGR